MDARPLARYPRRRRVSWNSCDPDFGCGLVCLAASAVLEAISVNSSTAGLSDQLRNVIRACFPIFCSLRRRSLARFDGRHRLGPRFRWRIKWAWNLRSMCGKCGRRRRSAVVWPPFLSCPGITTELARYICDPPVPAPGWAQKGRLLPHEAPFRFQRWLQTAYKSPVEDRCAGAAVMLLCRRQI